MPETDVTKMKVADLKRELKIRGLAVTGNKIELQERLQNVLLDGDVDISLEGSGLADSYAEDHLLEDELLTDEEEDESKILGGDENELLKSPTHSSLLDANDVEREFAAENAKNSLSTKKVINEIKSDSVVETPHSTAVIKDDISRVTSAASGKVSSPIDTVSSTTAISVAKSEGKSAETKSLKRSATADDEKSSANNVVRCGNVDISKMTAQERLEMRAKKFGTESKVENASIDMLKKRSERFGCVVSSKVAKLEAEEKLLKRKQRFESGSTGAAPVTSTTSTKIDATATATQSNVKSKDDDWAEKARQRLERFKTVSQPSTTSAEK